MSERWRRSFEVDSLHCLLQVIAAANQVAKVLSRNFGIHLEFAGLLFLELQLFDVALQTNADIVCGALERTADFRADTKCILVGVVDGGELLGELGGEAVWERLGH